MDYRRLYSMRAALVVAWALALVALIVIVGPGKILAAYQSVSPQSIRDFVLAFGALAVLAFLAVSAARPIFFLPVTPFTIASGFLFGLWLGLLWSFAGTTLSAILTFFLARYLLHGYMKARVAGRYPAIDKALEGRGWPFVAFLRMVPVMPFDLVGYVSGTSHIGFRDYMIGTWIGEAPGAIALVLLGASLTEIGSTMFYLSLALAAIVIVAPVILRQAVKWRKGQLEENEGPGG